MNPYKDDTENHRIAELEDELRQIKEKIDPLIEHTMHLVTDLGVAREALMSWKGWNGRLHPKASAALSKTAPRPKDGGEWR